MTCSKDLEFIQKHAVTVGSGSAKPPEPDDPMQIRAELVIGDQRVMLECLIEEFAHMGWDARQIARMFENPHFLASHGLTKRFGREAVRECIRQTLQRCGVFRCVMSELKSIRKSQFVSVPVSGDDSWRAKSKPV